MSNVFFVKEETEKYPADRYFSVRTKLRIEDENITKLTYQVMLYYESGYNAVKDALDEDTLYKCYSYVTEKIDSLTEIKTKFSIPDCNSNMEFIEHLFDLYVLDDNIEEINREFFIRQIGAVLSETLIKFTFIQIALNKMILEVRNN